MLFVKDRMLTYEEGGGVAVLRASHSQSLGLRENSLSWLEEHVNFWNNDNDDNQLLLYYE